MAELRGQSVDLPEERALEEARQAARQVVAELAARNQQLVSQSLDDYCQNIQLGGCQSYAELSQRLEAVRRGVLSRVQDYDLDQDKVQQAQLAIIHRETDRLCQTLDQALATAK